MKLADLFKTLIGPETSNCVALNENITLGQQLN